MSALPNFASLFDQPSAAPEAAPSSGSSLFAFPPPPSNAPPSPKPSATSLLPPITPSAPLSPVSSAKFPALFAPAPIPALPSSSFRLSGITTGIQAPTASSVPTQLSVRDSPGFNASHTIHAPPLSPPASLPPTNPRFSEQAEADTLPRSENYPPDIMQVDSSAGAAGAMPSSTVLPASEDSNMLDRPSNSTQSQQIQSSDPAEVEAADPRPKRPADSELADPRRFKIPRLNENLSLSSPVLNAAPAPAPLPPAPPLKLPPALFNLGRPQIQQAQPLMQQSQQPAPPQIASSHAPENENRPPANAVPSHARADTPKRMSPQMTSASEHKMQAPSMPMKPGPSLSIPPTKAAPAPVAEPPSFAAQHNPEKQVEFHQLQDFFVQSTREATEQLEALLQDLTQTDEQLRVLTMEMLVQNNEILSMQAHAMSQNVPTRSRSEE